MTRDGNNVPDKLTAANQLADSETLCLVVSQLSDTTSDPIYEYAIQKDGFMYPTCVTTQTNTDDRMIAATSGSASNHFNALSNSGFFMRNDYRAMNCPLIQDFCASQKVEYGGWNGDWWSAQVRTAFETAGFSAGLNGFPDNFESNVCQGNDYAVRYVTEEGFMNTCTGYKYTSIPDIASVSTTCEGVSNWECGTMMKNGVSMPGYPSSQFRSIARAFTQMPPRHPECSFDSSQYCGMQAEHTQAKFSLSDCITSGGADGRSQGNINWITGNANGRFADEDDVQLCVIQSSEGVWEYGAFHPSEGDSATVYPTCVAFDNCNSDSHVCLTSFSGAPLYNAMVTSSAPVIRAVDRNNLAHSKCPSTQRLCAVSEVNQYARSYVVPDTDEDGGEVDAEFTAEVVANVCFGEDMAVRYVTADGIVNTCTGLNLDPSNGSTDQDGECPASRSYTCGGRTNADGQKLFGWASQLYVTIKEALAQESKVHPTCAYDSCRFDACEY
jgi:hypothetical protein